MCVLWSLPSPNYKSYKSHDCKIVQFQIVYRINKNPNSPNPALMYWWLFVNIKQNTRMHSPSWLRVTRKRIQRRYQPLINWRWCWFAELEKMPAKWKTLLVCQCVERVLLHCARMHECRLLQIDYIYITTNYCKDNNNLDSISQFNFYSHQLNNENCQLLTSYLKTGGINL